MKFDWFDAFVWLGFGIAFIGVPIGAGIAFYAITGSLPP